MPTFAPPCSTSSFLLKTSGANTPVPFKTELTITSIGARMTKLPSFEEIFEAQIANLATTLQPGTLRGYRLAVKSFLRYLRANYPEIHTLSALRRAPHFLGWLRSFCEQQLPL